MESDWRSLNAPAPQHGGKLYQCVADPDLRPAQRARFRLATSPGGLSPRPSSRRGRRRRQLDWLHERAVACRIPYREAHPLLARRVERDLEVVLAERPEIGHRNDLAIGLLPVAPHDFGEL